MMQSATYALPGSRHMQPAYPHPNYFDDLSVQNPSTQQVRRLSRSSHGPRPSSMRVSKPSSANNSPTTSIMQSRRRTMMNDGYALKRQQQILEFLNANRNEMAAPQQRSLRPVSWHPSTHLQVPFQAMQPSLNYQVATPNMYAADYQDMYLSAPQFSPMMESYSNDTSPSSTFSPLPAALPTEAQFYGQPARWDAPQKAMPFYPTDTRTEPFPTMNQTTSSAGLDWNGFIINGFNNTSPPTPEGFLQAQVPQVTSEESVPVQEPEEEGEILVGMGLYDTPEKQDEDPHLNNYRSTVSSLLGSSFHSSEPRGKGLKLEETWEPPKADEEEEAEDEDDE